MILIFSKFEKMYNEKMMKNIGDVADIRFGYYAKPSPDKGVPYLQAKQFDVNGNIIAQPDTYLEPVQKVKEQLLNDGDVLFAGKGYKNFAWCYYSSFGDAVASTIFFVLTPNRNVILPEYLTTMLNYPKNQLYFQHLAAGNAIPSIRKSELAGFKIPVVALEVQQKIVEIYRLHQQEQQLTLALLSKKNERFESIFNTLANRI